jgi:GNAT superfamily N-acetyltransferase
VAYSVGPNGSNRDLFDRLERFYDSVPRRGARVEPFGSLVLFVKEHGWPLYARPLPGVEQPPTVTDVTAVRARQRELGLPEAFEWVHETTPALTDLASSAGLSILHAPLMVLDPAALPAPSRSASAAGPAAVALPADVGVRLLDPASATFGRDLAVSQAVAQVGFRAPGTATGVGGPSERDALVPELSDAEVADERTRITDGVRFAAIAESPTGGILATGKVQRVADVAEIVGVATLPSARRQGLAAAVTAELARASLAAGAELVFLSAGSEEIARVYAQVGFYRVGTACIAEGVSS